MSHRKVTIQIIDTDDEGNVYIREWVDCPKVGEAVAATLTEGLGLPAETIVSAELNRKIRTLADEEQSIVTTGQTS